MAYHATKRGELMSGGKTQTHHPLAHQTMNKLFLLILPALLLFSCKKENDLPREETITRGGKWNLQIGSSPADVYRQLQQLGVEKGFNSVAVVYRKAYQSPDDVRDRLSLYNSVTLQKESVYVDRVVIEFKQDKVGGILAGGAMLDDILQWPYDTPEEITIHADDPVDGLYIKLSAIYQMPPYNNYQIILPDKVLDRPFDPDMANYDQWQFTFSSDAGPAMQAMSSVTLYFSNGKLSRIRYYYNEMQVYY